MEVVVASHEFRKRLVLRDFTLDMEFGSQMKNDFTLSCGYRLYGGEVIWVPGTEYGGIVDDDSPTHSSSGDSISYHGRTWQGILNGNVLCPNAGSDYLTVSGDANDVIGQLLERCGIGEYFKADESGSVQVSYQFPRYCTLYEGLNAMLASVSQRLAFTSDDGFVTVGAAPVVDWGEYSTFESTRNYRPVNHLVVLGKGELKAREVINLYADEDGKVSKTQTLFGLDHRAEVYELSNKEGSELESDGIAKLEEYQSEKDKAEVKVGAGAGVAVGDVAVCDLPQYGVGAKATVTGIVVKGTGASLSVTTKSNGELVPKGAE